jgi:predicted ATPase
MKLDKLWIEEFKNLRDFNIDFDEDHLVTVIVGWNGAGKSNLIEALVIIFRDLDLVEKGEKSAFSYKLDYIIHGKKIIAQAKAGQAAILSVEEKKIAKKDIKSYLPKQVFGYYSGPSDRLLDHFKKHQEKFRDQLLSTTETIPERPLFYAQNIHSLFVLLAFFFKEDDEIQKFMTEELRIEGLDSILFVIKEPYWHQNKQRDEGNPRFWYSRSVVGDFLEKLYKRSLAPIRLSKRVEVGIKQTKTKEFVYLFIKSLEDFRELANEFESPSDFFKALESINFSDLLGDLRIRVKIRKMDGSLTFKELSEGEQQLLMVLGLLRFTREDESLFLLDEPDTHLNPSWSMKYLDLLRQVVGVNNQDTSHVIMTSHDPIMLAGLESQQLKIMKREESGKVSAESPTVGPRGLGYAGILTSPIFGLASELDSETLKKLARKKELETEETRTDSDQKELQKLDKEISELGFNETFRDPDYARFLKAWRQAGESFASQLKDSPEDQASKEAKALEIVRKLLGLDR